jgi:hypothetical protein
MSRLARYVPENLVGHGWYQSKHPRVAVSDTADSEMIWKILLCGLAPQNCT